MNFLSTLEVAHLMRVTETTVKRWADEGKLPCHKTLGGHRKFVLKDMLKFVDPHEYPVAGILPPEMNAAHREVLEFSLHTQNYAKISDIVLKEALRGERDRVSELLLYLSKHRLSIATIGDEIIRPAMVKIGQLWEQDRLEVNQEHIASNVILEAIVRVAPELRRKPLNGLTAVCACAEGEHHEIGLRILAYALEGEGWSVVYLGANTPYETLSSFVSSKRPSVVCLSYTMDHSRSQLVGRVQSIGKLVRTNKGVFLVGGLLSTTHTPEDFLCHHVSGSTRDAVSFLRERFHLKPGPKKREVLHKNLV